MRKQVLIWVSALGLLAGLWVTAVQSQVVQCGGSFVPTLNCTIAGRWNYTNLTTTANTVTQGPIPFQAVGQDVTGIVSRITTLTNAQVLALGTTPVTVVPAPGAGYYVDVIAVQVIFNYTAVYTGGSNLMLYYGSRASGSSASASITVSGLLVSVTEDHAFRVTGTPSNTDEPVTNVAVVISGQAGTAFAGGNAANSVRVVVNYRIVPTGL